MIDAAMLYIISAICVSTVVYLFIFISHEKVLKALEQEEREKEDVMPLLLTIRVARRFLVERLAIGRGYLYVWYCMLGMLPVMLFLLLLKSAIG
jgi:hypothetical protein